MPVFCALNTAKIERRQMIYDALREALKKNIKDFSAYWSRLQKIRAWKRRKYKINASKDKTQSIKISLLFA